MSSPLLKTEGGEGGQEGIQQGLLLWEPQVPLRQQQQEADTEGNRTWPESAGSPVPNPASDPRGQCGGGRSTETGTETGQSQWMRRNPGAEVSALALPLLGSVTLNESLAFFS